MNLNNEDMENMNRVRNMNVYENRHLLNRIENNDVGNPQEMEYNFNFEFQEEDVRQLYDEIMCFYFNDDEEDMLLCNPNILYGYLCEKQLDKNDAMKVFELVIYRLEKWLEEENRHNNIDRLNENKEMLVRFVREIM